MMLVQTGSVIQILTGRDSGWSAQARDADRVPWSLLWRFHRRHILIGLLLGLAAGAISWRLLAWMSPALVGLILAVPLSAFMGSAAAGRWLLRLGLLETPEELDPPPLAAAADRDAAELRERCRVPDGLAGLLADPEAYRRHLAWLDPPTSRQPGQSDAALASALLKLADGLGRRIARRQGDLRRPRLRPDPRRPRPAPARPAPPVTSACRALSAAPSEVFLIQPRQGG